MQALLSTLAMLNFVFATQGRGNFFLRMPLGVIFIVHGGQKLFGWFEGEGLTATADWMAQQLGGDGMLLAVLAGGAEFFGGILLFIGFLVRPAAFALMIVMMVAIRAVHWEHGLLLQNGGFEFALSLLAGTAALLFGGAGVWSLDRLIAQKYKD